MHSQCMATPRRLAQLHPPGRPPEPRACALPARWWKGRKEWKESRLATFALLLLVAAGAGAQQYEITLAAQPPGAGSHYSTQGDGLTLTVAAGQRVTLSEERGSEQSLRGVGLFWVQVAEVPRDANVISLTPRARDDDAVDVQVEYLSRSGERQRSFSSTVTAMPGEWTRLYGPAQSQTRSTRTYSTAQRPEDSLYLYLVPR
jgi:hypothetical protein